jgi:excisionase family DNA binding protein
MHKVHETQEEERETISQPHQCSQSSSPNLLDKELLTIDEAAEVLQVKKSWLYAQTRQSGPGSIPCIRVGKYLRFQPPALMEWIKIKQSDWFFRCPRR